MLGTAERLVQAQNIRAFEAYLTSIARSVQAPCVQWVSATVAYPAELAAEPPPPSVVVLVALRPRAWWALGVLHLVARYRLRKVLGPERQGYRVRVGVITA